MAQLSLQDENKLKDAQEQWARYMYMRDNGHRQFIEKADKCDNFFAGFQWNEADLLKLRAVGRPALTINKILPTLATLFGEQIYNRMEVAFRPADNGTIETADALNKVWQHIADKNQLHWVRSDVFADGAIRSRGFYDARIEFDDNMRGDVVITKLNSKNVVLDPDADQYDPDTWNDVVVSKWLTPADIEILYGEEFADELRSRDVSNYLYGYDSIERRRDRVSGPYQTGTYAFNSFKTQRRYIRVLERQFKEATRRDVFVDPITGESRPVPDNWDRNRIALVAAKYGLTVVKKVVKRIKWRTTADDLVMHDSWSPYNHFTVIPFFPYFRDGRTIGLVENLIDSQELLNKASSQELHVINTTANSGWKVKTGALRNLTVEDLEERGAETGLVLEVDDVENVEKIQPNQIPSGLDRITFKAEEAIKTISNVSDSMQGFDREDVAAKAIQAKQQRGSVNFVKVMDNLERTDWFLARHVLDMVQNFYTEERTLAILGDSGLDAQTEQLVVNQNDTAAGRIVNDLTLGEYHIVVTSAPYRATQEDSQFEQAVSLRELGVPIPDNVLIENSRLARKAELARQLSEVANDPVKQQQIQLQLRDLEASVAEKEAKAAKLGAEAAKVGTEQEADPQAEINLKRYEIDQRIALEREKMQNEMQLKREAQEAELQIKREAAAAQAHAQRVSAAMNQPSTTPQQPAA